MSCQNCNYGGSIIPKLKKFVRASDSSSSCVGPNDKVVRAFNGSLEFRGEDVTDFYKTMLQEKSEDKCVINIDDDPLEDNDDIYILGEKYNTDTISADKMMRYAESNDVRNMALCIKKGISIDTCDQYGWSVLMVAAAAGSIDIIKYLIDKKADINITDKSGNTALSLARENKHYKVMKLLDGAFADESLQLDGINNESIFYCNICKVEVTCSEAEHNLSIIHVMQMGSGNLKPFFGIPSTNKGFQMLVDQGWNTDEGLGPSGKGKIYPITTALKNNRLGIGHSNADKKNKNNRGITADKNFKKHLQGRRKKCKQIYTVEESDIRKILNEPDYTSN